MLKPSCSIGSWNHHINWFPWGARIPFQDTGISACSLRIWSSGGWTSKSLRHDLNDSSLNLSKFPFLFATAVSNFRRQIYKQLHSCITKMCKHTLPQFAFLRTRIFHKTPRVFWFLNKNTRIHKTRLSPFVRGLVGCKDPFSAKQPLRSVLWGVSFAASTWLT